MVAIAMQLTSLSQLPILLIGVMVLSVGTALPELALEIEAIRKREMNMAFGGIIGSIVINATLILGLTSIISPINLTVGLKPYLLSVVCFILLFGLFWKFTGSKHRLERWEGGVLVLTYLLFAAAQFYLNI